MAQSAIPVTPPKLAPTSEAIPLSYANPSVTTVAPASSVSVTVPNTTGKVTFAVVVTDNLGLESAPAYATVTVQGPPTAVLTATPETIAEGAAIVLSGAGSTSSGNIAKYTFSLVPSAA